MRAVAFRVVLALAMGCAHPPAAPPLASAPPAGRGGPVVAPIAEAPATSAPRVPTEEEVVERLAAPLTLEQKVGQLMMVGFAGQAVDASVAALVGGRQVGGVCLFGRNLADAAQVARLNDELRALLAGGVPPFLAVDQEGGNVVRLDVGNLVLPGNMLLGATFDASLAQEAGLRQGEDLWRLGFNMNLAPVLDVNTNPRNPVIGIRAFSDDVALVSRLGAAFVQGQQAARIATIAKHFPGHGSADLDSHRALPVLVGSPQRIRAQLSPFTAAAAVGLDGMMTAHVAVPALSGDDTPATLSPVVLGKVLREELKFDGLVLTDELEMDAIDHRYGVGRAAVLAIAAGADMVLIPWRVEKKTEVYEALLAAARSGGLPRARLDQAVRRILKVKVRRGLYTPLPPREARLQALGASRELAERIARAGVTLLRRTQDFPLDSRRRVGVVTAEASLAEALGRRLPGVERLVVPAYPPEAARDGLKRATRLLAQRSEVVVVGVTNSRQLELASIAALEGKPVVVVVMGAPYLATQVHLKATVLLVYSYRASASEAAAAALTGELGTPGRLPVVLPGAPLGWGLDPVGARADRRPPE
jgi:beta-N-acetylhexosaminidase